MIDPKHERPNAIVQCLTDALRKSLVELDRTILGDTYEEQARLELWLEVFDKITDEHENRLYELDDDAGDIGDIDEFVDEHDAEEIDDDEFDEDE